MWNTGFEILDLRQQGTVIPERWETDEVSASVIPAYGLEEFLVCDTGREIQAEPSELSKLKKTDEESKKFKVAIVYRTEKGRGESDKEREPQRSAEGPC